MQVAIIESKYKEFITKYLYCVMYTFVGDGFFSQSRLSRHNCRVNKPENKGRIAIYFTLNNGYKEIEVTRKLQLVF